MLNPLDYPVIFLDTQYAAPSAWWQHTPFARFIVALTQPSLLVELGTHYGVSYFAFCQAVRALGLHTRCYAVDTWQGDEQAGFYDEEVFEQVQQHNAQHYSTFSRLLRMTFDEALQHFAEGEVDLLHIDGYHTYEAVQHDYENWLPKMSQRGVILFHDINVREGTFGVWQLWNELRERFPHFEFLHEHGLGVLAVGEEAAALLDPLSSLSESECQRVRVLFSQLGERVRLRIELESAQREIATARSYIQYIEERLNEQLKRFEATTAELERTQAHIQHLESELALQAQQLKHLEATTAELERAQAHIQHLESELAAQIQDRQAEQAAHRQEIEQARSYIQHIEDESNARALYLQQAEAGLEELRRALAEAETVRAALEGQLNETESARATLEGRLTELQNAHAALQAQLAASQGMCTTLEARLAESEAARADLEVQLAKLEGERATLQARLAETMSAAERLERKLSYYRSLT